MEYVDNGMRVIYNRRNEKAEIEDLDFVESGIGQESDSDKHSGQEHLVESVGPNPNLVECGNQGAIHQEPFYTENASDQEPENDNDEEPDGEETDPNDGQEPENDSDQEAYRIESDDGQEPDPTGNDDDQEPLLIENSKGQDYISGQELDPIENEVGSDVPLVITHLD